MKGDWGTFKGFHRSGKGMGKGSGKGAGSDPPHRVGRMGKATKVGKGKSKDAQSGRSTQSPSLQCKGCQSAAGEGC
eukprot:1515121-Karenia_brevis.AAC.1